VKIVQHGRNYLYLNFHEFSINTFEAISVYVLYTRSITSERNFGTLAKVNRLCVLSRYCSARLKLLISQIHEFSINIHGVLGIICNSTNFRSFIFFYF